ncbi:MAG: hypothetical protein WDN31_22765 [Hyphomicrobium sp.]
MGGGNWMRNIGSARGVVGRQASTAPALILGLALILCSAWAASPVRAEAARAEVGVSFSAIYNIDFINGSFGADFHMWWISADPAFRPFEVMQIINGRQWTVRAVSRRQLPDGRYHTSGLVSATINHYWHLRRFPYDAHTLQIAIETPSMAAELRLVPDPKSLELTEFLSIEGFHVLGLRVKENVKHYTTNFGMEGVSAQDFSRLVMELDLKRKSSRFLISFLIGFIAANIIALLTYAIHVSDLTIRSSMIGSAIFAAIGNTYYMNAALNPAANSLLVDVFTVVSFAVIIVALLNSIIVHRLIRRQRSRLAHIVNRMMFYATSIGAAFAYAATFYLVWRGPFE